MPIADRLVDPGDEVPAPGDPVSDLRGLIADLEPGRYTVE
jgi:hypothetical protein